MQFLACVLKAVIRGVIIPRAYIEREWDRIQSVRICCFGDLPVSASSFNIRAIVAIPVTAEVFKTWGCAMLRQDQRGKTSIRVTQLFSCAACGLALLAQGCMSGNGTKKTSSVKSTKNVQSSMPELSSRNQSMLALYSAEIEVAAAELFRNRPRPPLRGRHWYGRPRRFRLCRHPC
jgi:hypothetical protein